MTPAFRRTTTYVFLAGLTFIPITATAETVTLAPVRDATLIQTSSGILSNGAGEFIFAGSTDDGFARRALLLFDIAGAVPPNAIITEAVLTLHLSRSGRGFGSATVTVHRVSENWTEGTTDAPGHEGSGDRSTPGSATWMHRSYPDTLWSTAGGAHVPTTSTSRTVGTVLMHVAWPSTPQFVADVQSMLTSPSANFGWILKSTLTKRFGARENAQAQHRPQLTVTYTVPTEAAPADPGVSRAGMEGHVAVIDSIVKPAAVSVIGASDSEPLSPLAGGDGPRLLHGEPGVSFYIHAFSTYIDPAGESTDGQTITLGLDRIELVFSEPVRDIGGVELTPAAFTVTETGTATPPLVIAVETGDRRRVKALLSRKLTLREWTTIVALVENDLGQPILSEGNLGPGVNEPDRIDIGYLPTDLNQNGIVNPLDSLRFKQYIAGVFIAPRGIRRDYVDLDRDLNINPMDLLWFKRLVNGIFPSTQTWSGKTMLHTQP